MKRTKSLLEEILELSPDVAETIDTEAEDWEDLIDTHEDGTKDALSESQSDEISDISKEYLKIFKSAGFTKISEPNPKIYGDSIGIQFEFPKRYPISLDMQTLQKLSKVMSNSTMNFNTWTDGTHIIEFEWPTLDDED